MTGDFEVLKSFMETPARYRTQPDGSTKEIEGHGKLHLELTQPAREMKVVPLERSLVFLV